MTRIMQTTIAALFGTTMLATPVLAQTDGNPSDAPSNTGSEPLKIEPGTGTTMAVDTNTTAAIGTNFDGAMSMIGDTAVSTAIESMPDVGDVRIVSMGSLEYADKNRIEQAMGEKDAEIQQLRAVIAANPTISAELASKSMAASDVVAADVAANGEVVVYTR